ncbi:hypothetical protein IW261DRAFT_1560276 [Armillaria novae-zelandiae]|uniref:Uncharacterized protein n=1 Tax=Armillaria novae-zelandiae TaxID=153914 RepID=A0AA39PHZ5_9AGAR|nr:hypothetical protein IW261DRAFT_1560276 [Armillaria novae-zelandiae]
MAAEIDGSAVYILDDTALKFKNLDAVFNSTIFQGQLFGLYTGIVAFTIWNIYANKCIPVGRAMIAVLLILHVLAAVDFALQWSYIHIIYIKHGQSSGNEYLVYSSPDNVEIGIAITSIISTIFVDSAMIWRCWMVWGRRWPIVVLPILSLICGSVSRIIMTIEQCTNPEPNTLINLLLILYQIFILATILWCTLLIIFRILSIGRANAGSGGPTTVYRRVIEILVESSALYAIFVLLNIVLVACKNAANNYMETVASIARGVAPTLLIGRVAAGQARPDDSWQGSVMSSLRFGRDSEQMGSQADTTESVTVNIDLEDQPEREDHLEGVSQ